MSITSPPWTVQNNHLKTKLVWDFDLQYSPECSCALILSQILQPCVRRCCCTSVLHQYLLNAWKFTWMNNRHILWKCLHLDLKKYEKWDQFIYTYLCIYIQFYMHRKGINRNIFSAFTYYIYIFWITSIMDICLIYIGMW